MAPRHSWRLARLRTYLEPTVDRAGLPEARRLPGHDLKAVEANRKPRWDRKAPVLQEAFQKMAKPR